MSVRLSEARPMVGEGGEEEGSDRGGQPSGTELAQVWGAVLLERPDSMKEAGG